jgi:uncharacterized iron-regulated protein
MRVLVAFAALLCACAHPATAPRGAGVPIALPHTIVDGQSGATVDAAALDARLAAARVVYVGEEHPNPHHHAVELEVLERAFAVDPQVALGLEMLPRTLQPALDDFVAGRSDEAAFLRAVDWEHTWGYPFGYYRPLLEFCRKHGLRAIALNAPRAIAHKVALGGLDALSPDERAALPELRPGPEAHREYVREAYGAHARGRFSDGGFERFYAAQLVWDETMADGVAAALSDEKTHRVVVVAGEGHVRRWAVPERAARRGAQPYLLIVSLFARDRADALTERVADLLWVLRSP